MASLTALFSIELLLDVILLCLIVVLLRVALRINKSIEQRDEIIQLLKELNQPNKEASVQNGGQKRPFYINRQNGGQESPFSINRDTP